ncbi:hypothetical protein JXA88_10160 [Candidatus Fermentibacteria bacterium]|nr:hypothetical protein [Candidatus Fermentibacteria bacterium]
MNSPTREEQKRLIRQWEITGRDLERLRREALRDMPYRWTDVDALLEIGDRAGCAPRRTSGLVEMQRVFMRAARSGT